jgi:hypothetical protein
MRPRLIHRGQPAAGLDSFLGAGADSVFVFSAVVADLVSAFAAGFFVDSRESVR